jgi:DNA-binding MarR family transcriptional regulator
MSEHPTTGLNETVHQRHRLGTLTIAVESKQVDFGYLKKTLDMTAGNLSRHIGIREEAGTVEVEKGYAGKRPRTWVSITAAGKRALAEELAVLQALVAGIQTADTA